MHGIKQASEVAQAFASGRAAKRGNASSDGVSYYLFDNEIVCRGGPADVQVRNRLMGRRTDTLYFTFAGWVTASTVRHLNVLLPWRVSSARGRPFVNFKGQDVELDRNQWYSVYELDALLIKEHENESVSR